MFVACHGNFGHGNFGPPDQNFRCIPYYMNTNHIIGKVLPIKRKLTNDYDHFAVAVLKDGEVVGHAPRMLS